MKRARSVADGVNCFFNKASEENVPSGWMCYRWFRNWWTRTTSRRSRSCLCSWELCTSAWRFGSRRKTGCASRTVSWTRLSLPSWKIRRGHTWSAEGSRRCRQSRSTSPMPGLSLSSSSFRTWRRDFSPWVSSWFSVSHALGSRKRSTRTRITSRRRNARLRALQPATTASDLTAAGRQLLFPPANDLLQQMIYLLLIHCFTHLVISSKLSQPIIFFLPVDRNVHAPNVMLICQNCEIHPPQYIFSPTNIRRSAPMHFPLSSFSRDADASTERVIVGKLEEAGAKSVSSSLFETVSQYSSRFSIWYLPFTEV